MRTPAWQRVVARIVLVTFTTGIVACGDATREAASSSTTLPEAQAGTTVPPPTETIPPPPPTNPPPTPPSTLPAEAPAQISKQELRDLVAPIALYPDVVLSSLLPATTYPEQVHDAAVYVGDAEQVDRIPDDRGWDGSVIGLLQFPDVVRWLDENPAWTDQMGQAVTYQQGDVLEAIQDYRKAVKNVGNLQSNQYQKVRTGKNEDVYIEPARPDVVYVPSYDPVVATQPQPPAAESPGINPWIAFGGGALVGALGAWALYSIFDDDDDHDHGYYYGGRRIRGYDNYYYARGRRPRTVAWAPRQRQWRQVNGWREPRRLRYAAPAARPGRRPVALRPPTKRVGAPAPYATETKRDQRQLQKQERRERQQQKQLEQQTQRQQKQQRQLDQKQQRQQRNQAEKQQQQERRQQKQTQQRDRRQQQQIQKQGQQNQRQERRQQQQMEERERRQEQQMQRQERRQEQQTQRQEKKGQQQNQGGNGGGGGGGGKGNNNKKKKGNQ